jgi:2-methylcitrate dehydratase PrpD
MSATAKLARFSSHPPDWPQEARKGAARAFADTLACALGGARDPATEGVLRAVSRWGLGPATVIGQGARLPSPSAALVNGTAAHALDYDDVLEPPVAHVSAVLVPALLALAEERELPGERVIDAYLVGFEVMARLGEGVNLVHYSRGWHTTSTLGAPAAAAACARLIGLDEGRARHALGLAMSFASGSKVQFGSHAKPMHAGMAAKAGIVAAAMAEAGVTAVAEVYTGPWSFEALYSGPEALGIEEALARLGDPPAMLEHGIWMKPWPCCASAHRPIDALLRLRERHALGAGEVDSIEATLSEVAWRNLRFDAPSTAMGARFSLQHPLALALVDGRVGIGGFTAEAIRRPELRGLYDRITRRADPDLPGTRRPEPGTERATLVVRLGDGTELSATIVDPLGHPSAPLDDDALRLKFRDCAAGLLAPEAADRAFELALGGLDDLTALTRLVQPGGNA